MKIGILADGRTSATHGAVPIIDHGHVFDIGIDYRLAWAAALKAAA